LLPYPVLDPRNEVELAESAQRHANLVSSGALSDFTDNSPLAALIQGQAFAGAELLWYANGVYKAIAATLLNLVGVERSLGTPARVTLTFNLSSALTTPWQVSSGFEVRTTSSLSDLVFVTDTDLVIPPGSTSGEVSATATQLGSVGNVGPRSLTRSIVPLAFLASVTNESGAAGGTDPETDEDFERRATTALRRREILVTLADYEAKLGELLGPGSFVVGLRATGRDRQPEPGSVHLFAVGPDGNPPTEQLCSDLEQTLGTLVPATTEVYVSPAVVKDLTVGVTVEGVAGVADSVIFDNVVATVRSWVDPRRFPVSDVVSREDLAYRIRRGADDLISAVYSVQLDGVGIDTLLENPWVRPRAESIQVEILRGSAVSFVGAVGVGDLD
jgi:hypothetical protein